MGVVFFIEVWWVEGVIFVVVFIIDIFFFDNCLVISCVGYVCWSWEFDEWSCFNEFNVYVIYRIMKFFGFKF